MKSRRAFLASAALAVPAAATAAVAADPSVDNPAFKNCPRAITGPNADRFPQVVVQDQYGQKAWFYEELIYNKLVLVNFTSVKGEKHYPIIENLVRVQEMLGERLGDDVFIYTVTTKPHEDSAESLRELADRHGAKWQFLNGDPEAIREVLAAFNVRGSINGLAWIGNEKTGRWLSKASRQHPLYIAEAVARLSTGKHYKPFLIDMHSA